MKRTLSAISFLSTSLDVSGKTKAQARIHSLSDLVAYEKFQIGDMPSRMVPGATIPQQQPLGQELQE
eukprot:12045373-Ditylum_brightwellii.AAC.1